MSAATTAVFLFLGLDDERRKSPGQEWPLGHNEGFLELVQNVEAMAEQLEKDWETHYYLLECPGVWDYEVTEEMGGWLYRNPDATKEEFSAELARFVTAWVGGRNT